MLRVSFRQVSQKVHYPVMWRTVRDLFQPLGVQNKAVLIADGTVGVGGHSRTLLESIPNSYVIGMDIDKDALTIAEQNLKEFEGRVQLVHSSYTTLWKQKRFPGVLEAGKRFDGVLLDLGMSSLQLDTPERGFSYSKPGPLDMRFNRSDPLLPTAHQIINFASELELRELFRLYGEEPLHRQAADVIVRYREKQPIKTTKELADVLNYAFFISKSLNRFQSIGRCFQALRIKVNDEFANIEKFLEEIFAHVEVNGVIVIISFHSLEDVKVKEQMERWMGSEVADLPERHYLPPGPEELAENSRSGSARLRYCIKRRDFTMFRKRT